jgi:tripartite-type tricarboxylate transporter receptor subunit TctC
MKKWMFYTAGFVLSSQLTAATFADVKKPEGFPQRPVTIIVPFGPGGGSDQFARALAGPMGKALGVPIQVVNKPGGGGRAGIPDFMAAPADGYTIMQFSDDVLTLYSAGKIKEHPTKDWTPIGIGNITFSQIYMTPDNAKFSDWQSFVMYTKVKPGEATMANISHKGSMELVTMHALEQALGIKVQQVSFDKPAERYAALMGGHTDTLFEQPGDVATFLTAKKMKPILTILKERPKAFPDVPSLTDIGVEFEPLLRVRGMVVKSGVPTDRLRYLEWAFKQAYDSKDFQTFLEKKYMTIIDSYRNLNQATKLIDSTIATYTKAYKEK